MIYRDGYLGKELRQASSSARAGPRKKTAFGLFLGLLSFSFYFMAQTMTESIFAETLPQVMQANFFSTAYIYIHVALVLFTFYLIYHYPDLLFVEIRDNAWYPLQKAGRRPASMIFLKAVGLLSSTVYIYTIGFIFTVFLTFFLKYGLEAPYLPALYLTGLMDVLVMTVLALFLSVFIRTVINGRYLTLLALVLLFVLKVRTGYSRLVANRLAMVDAGVLFNPGRSRFTLIVAALAGLALLLAFAGALGRSRKITVKAPGMLPHDREVLVINRKTGRKRTLDERRVSGSRKKLFDGVISFLIVFFILVALIINAGILVINATSTGKHVAIRGVIPYIFKTRTMEPEIKLNDLAFFDVYQENQLIEVGQIILFDEKEDFFVERVTAKDASGYTVDIDSYPAGADQGAMIKEVNRDQIAGVYKSRSRWLGALILFANTIFGRILFLLIPALLLFFQKYVLHRKEREDHPPLH